ncbi:MAG: DUF348 domain-containing protein [Firmicutes bacterium]|nr:DUF348 domain-containing protein [Bacillota bacterium]
MGSTPMAKNRRHKLILGVVMLVVFLGSGLYFTMVKTVTITADGEHLSITSLAGRVEDVLQVAGIALEDGDVVEPDLDQKLVKGMEIQVQRSFPVAVAVDGDVISTRFTGGTVAELLKQLGVRVEDLDLVEPALTWKLNSDLPQDIYITRITKDHVVEEREVAFGSKQWAEPTLERGKTKLIRKGQSGKIHDTFEVVYADGEEIERTLVSSLVVQEPRDEIIGLGTKEAWNTISADGSAIRYRDAVDMTATAYYPGPESTGEWADGYTATGVKAGYGIAAVDPKLIPLGTRLYVPGYGHALAADVGGAIKGKRIDLCFETYQEAIQYGRREVKVYILD